MYICVLIPIFAENKYFYMSENEKLYDFCNKNCDNSLYIDEKKFVKIEKDVTTPNTLAFRLTYVDFVVVVYKSTTFDSTNIDFRNVKKINFNECMRLIYGVKVVSTNDDFKVGNFYIKKLNKILDKLC